MNKLSAARKNVAERKAVEKKQIAQKNEAKKDKVKGKFGDRAWDHMKVSKHDFRHPESCRVDHNPCSFCRLVQLQCDKMFKFEEETAARAREESMVRRAEMRFRLLGGWSRNQGSYYDDMLPSTFKDSLLVDISINHKLVESFVEYMEFKETIAGKERLWGFGLNNNTDDPSLFGSQVGGGGSTFKDMAVIDMIEINKILQRRKRILEVGKYAATFLQARIRKISARKRVRLYVMRRYEYNPATKARNEMIIDKETNGIVEQPQMIEDVKLNTPRTMNRKFAAMERARTARLQNYQKYISQFIDRETGDFYDLFAMEERRMTNIRNFVVLRDVIAAGMNTLTRQIREFREGSKGVVEEDSEEEEENNNEGGGVAGKKTEIDGESAVSGTGTGTDSVVIGIGGLDTTTGGGSVASLDSLATIESLYEPCWLSLAAPAPPSRDLGITIALETPFKPPERGGDGLNPLFLILERKAWDALKCRAPEDIVEKLLNDNLHPPLQSCVHIADDDQNIWRGDSKVLPMNSKGDSSRSEPTTEKKSEEKKSEEKKEEEPPSEAERIAQLMANNINKGHILPVTIQLRPIISNKIGPKDIFRLFFVDGELCGITAYSPWAFYPDVAKDKDILLRAIQAFATTQEMRSFVHSYCNRANYSLLQASGAINKNGLVDFAQDKETDAQDEENAAMAAKLSAETAAITSPTSKRKNSIMPKDARAMAKAGSSVVAASPDRKMSVMGNSMRGSATLEKQLKDEQSRMKSAPRCTPLYVPPQEFVFYNGDYLESPKLSSEEVVGLTKQYSFLKKMELWKPLLIKAQNEMFRKSGKEQKEEIKSATSHTVQQLHASRMQVLNDVPQGYELLGTQVFRSYNMDVPGGLGQSEAVSEKYYDALSTISVGADCGISNRILKPILKELPDLPKLKIKGQVSQAEKDDMARQEVESLKTEEERQWEAKQKLKSHSLGLEMPALNLMVIEVAVNDETPKKKAKPAANAAPAPVVRKGSPAKKGPGGKDAKDEAAVPRRVVNLKLHQVIGVFSCDRTVNERPPPSIDCGLLEWDHFCDMNDVASFEKEIHPLEWLSKPVTPGYFIPKEKSERPWSHPNASGAVKHVCSLKSKKTLIMSVLGMPPDRDSLVHTVPRNIKNWLGI